VFSLAQTCSIPVTSDTIDCTDYAVGRGQLGMDGLQLVDVFGQPVQLRGISSNGLQHSPYCATKESISHFVTTWGINVYRAAIYVDEWENGYTVNAPFFDDFIENIVQWCKELGIYVIIDWHIIGDPNAYLDEWYQGTSGLAVDFFEKYSLLYKDETHVLYEIANEPFNVGWESLVWYHNLIITTIRNNDPHAIIIAGTPNYSQEIDKAYANPVTNPHNVFYAFHFYAADHGDLIPFFEEYVTKLPLFVSAWGISDFDGDGPYNISVAESYLLKCSGILGTAVSWLQWSLTDIDETASILEPSSCTTKRWDDIRCPSRFTENYFKSRLYGDAVLDCDRAPTPSPTISSIPTGQPTGQPSTVPTPAPSKIPTNQPTGEPSVVPSISQVPTAPTNLPTIWPSSQPTGQPSSEPTRTEEPTIYVAPANALSAADEPLIPPEGIFFIVAGGIGMAVTAWYFYENSKKKSTYERDVKEMRTHFHPIGAPQGQGASGGGRGAGGGGRGGGEMDMGNIYTNQDEGTFSAANSDLTQSIVEMEEFEDQSVLHPGSVTPPGRNTPSPPPNSSAALLSKQHSATGSNNSTSRGQDTSPLRRQGSSRRNISPKRNTRRMPSSDNNSVSSSTRSYRM